MLVKKVIKKLLGRNAYERRVAYLTKKNLNRALAFREYFTLIQNVKGDIVECGVGEGYGQCLLLHFSELFNRTERIWGFDSFEGFPELSDNDRRDLWFKYGLKEYQNFDVAFVNKSLADYGHATADTERRISLVKGFIPESLRFYDGSPIAFLHLDLDIYEGYRDSLNFFWDKVAPGGVVAFDEYLKPLDVQKWPGASIAIREFLEKHQLTDQLRWNALSGNPYLIKP